MIQKVYTGLQKISWGGKMGGPPKFFNINIQETS